VTTRPRLLAHAGLWCLCTLLAACARFQPQPLELAVDRLDIHTETRFGLTVSTTILPDAQAERLYGVDLAGAGLQAIWLRIHNETDHGYWLLVSRLDPNYFAPDEAAFLFHPALGDADDTRVTQHFRRLAIPLKVPAGGASEGYVLTSRHEGGRYLIVSLAGARNTVDFGFPVILPDGYFDFEGLDPERIYAGKQLPELTLEQLRAALRELPCCTSDESGERSGDPINLVIVGDATDVLASLSRGGWSFTHRIDASTVQRLIGATISGGSYPVAPVSPLYLFGRPQDLALQRARNTIVQRNHLRLWLAPYRFEGQSVWVGQVSRDIGIKLTTLSPTLTTHVIDPNVDEAREHLLQSLMVAGVLRRFAFVSGVPPATPEAPHTNLTEDPYFTDGFRLVTQLSGGRTVAVEDVEFLDWKESADPNRSARR